MAEIQPKGDSGGKGGKKRAKKMSTKIDMTPMVDLAFLLLTFFMLTTTFAKPNVMQLTMPVKEKNPEEQTVLKASDAFTIIMGEKDKLYYYEGLLDENVKPQLKLSDYSADGIRKILLARQRQNPKTVVRQTRQYLLILKSGLMICMFDAAYTYIYETVKDARRCVNTYPGN